MAETYNLIGGKILQSGPFVREELDYAPGISGEYTTKSPKLIPITPAEVVAIALGNRPDLVAVDGTAYICYVNSTHRFADTLTQLEFTHSVFEVQAGALVRLSPKRFVP